MTPDAILQLRQALCFLLGLTDHQASSSLARLGICLADIHLGAAITRYDELIQIAEALWQREQAAKAPIEGSA
jgi:hypothetical protein